MTQKKREKKTESPIKESKLLYRHRIPSRYMGKLHVKAAVIGAGMAGLVAARELCREGHQVVVFERANDVGGTWLYDPRIESDPLGLDPGRNIVHASMYRSLRVNLPRQLMGFSDYPFLKKGWGDPRSFPGHEEVLRFLRGFMEDSGLIELIRFGLSQPSRVLEPKRFGTNRFDINCRVRSL